MVGNITVVIARLAINAAEELWIPQAKMLDLQHCH
jgi:hypothetical protein